MLIYIMYGVVVMYWIFLAYALRDGVKKRKQIAEAREQLRWMVEEMKQERDKFKELNKVDK